MKMDCRIEISPLAKWRDSRGESVRSQITNFLNLPINTIRTRDVYTISANISRADSDKIAAELTNPVLQSSLVGETRSLECDWLIAVGFKPGVTDNVGRSAREAVSDILNRKLGEDETIFSSIEYIINAPDLTKEQTEHIAKDLLANDLIESIAVFSKEALAQDSIPLNLPFVDFADEAVANNVDLSVSDEELIAISKKGTLSLDLNEMKTIQKYFKTAGGREAVGLGEEPTDVEIEVLAQTWSEHCCHKVFAATVDYEDEKGNKETVKSCFKSYIMKSTKEIGEEVDWLVSVFWDNAGVIHFNDEIDLVYKVETHNSPSALDPFGGAMTGIVGVNRDPMGTGLGANLLTNVWGYCLGSPFTAESDVPKGLLHPRHLRDGVHAGVIAGGNESGIPYGLGWEYFDERYLGKPLVYCGTVATLPKKLKTKIAAEKTIEPGDMIVMVGGRIGKDGIHGATFSSEELHADSPMAAVQIGDPITQKKVGDFIYEARDNELYRFVTDNGAGGLSSSIGEMAEFSGGCKMDLAKCPLKYAGMQPWEIMISEAQERMSFAVPPEDVDAFLKLAESRSVEATVLGEFTNSGKFHMTYGEKTVAYLDMEFLHDGCPVMTIPGKWVPPTFEEPKFDQRNVAEDMTAMIARLNICSNEYKARQYDHEVKGLSCIKPFVGTERDILSDATVSMIEPLSDEGVILSMAVMPKYSEIDTYHMTASVIDQSIRKIIAVGGNMDMIAGLDNFCWPDPVESEKTPDGAYKAAQLVRANQAIYDYTKAFLVPCISGKDSCKNDSTIGGKKISIPPTLLFSAISKMNDVKKSVTLAAKNKGDVVYVIGDTKAELGGSEYFSMLGATGNAVPKVDADYAKSIFNAVAKVTDAELAQSLTTPVLGGLAVSFAKTAMGGRLGLEIDLDAIPTSAKLNAQEILFSESNSRFVMTVKAADAAKVETILGNIPFAKVGKVTSDNMICVKSVTNPAFTVSIKDLVNQYKGTLAGI